MPERKLNMGMLGGGPGAFIGEVHRKAARMDGGAELTAGAFSSDPEKSRQMTQELCLDNDRVYESWEQMIEREKALPEGQRIDFVAITTPNNTHYPMAKAFLEAGFHVMCEKPMTLTSEEAKDLKTLVDKSGMVFGLMHNYTGYPMVKLARDIVRDGDIGNVRKIVVQYPQGWLATPLEREGHQQASWRSDPRQSGAGGCVGDIGSHAENLAEYITGLKISEICAELTSFVEGRLLDDDCNCLVKFDNGAKGVLHASQISVGEENNLAIWIYGEKGGIEWHQEHPNYLYVKSINGAEQVWKRGNDYVSGRSPAAGRATRLPFGHPEAFLEAFANHYCNFIDVINCRRASRAPDPLMLDFPGVADGVRGMLFIESVVESSRMDRKWMPIKK